MTQHFNEYKKHAIFQNIYKWKLSCVLFLVSPLKNKNGGAFKNIRLLRASSPPRLCAYFPWASTAWNCFRVSHSKATRSNEIPPARRHHTYYLCLPLSPPAPGCIVYGNSRVKRDRATRRKLWTPSRWRVFFTRSFAGVAFINLFTGGKPRRKSFPINNNVSITRGFRDVRHKLIFIPLRRRQPSVRRGRPEVGHGGTIGISSWWGAGMGWYLLLTNEIHNNLGKHKKPFAYF